MSIPIELSTVMPRNNVEISPEKQQIETEKPKQSFADMLAKSVDSVNETMLESDQKVQDFVAGKTDNVHDVMISMQRAKVSFQMMVEVRNKVVETYKEISRMQI